MKNRRYMLSFFILGMLVLAFLALNLCAGSVPVPFGSVLDILMGREADPVYQDIILKIRFPARWQRLFWEAVLPCPVIFCRPFSTIPLRGLLPWVFPPEPSWWLRL